MKNTISLNTITQGLEEKAWLSTMWNYLCGVSYDGSIKKDSFFRGMTYLRRLPLDPMNVSRVSM